MLLKSFFKFSLLVGILAFGQAQAQTVLATVNGVAVPSTLLDLVVQNNANQDVKDSPELRLVIRNELILREVLSQEAAKMGLDQGEDFKTQLFLLRQNYLSELLIADHLKKNPVNEEEIRKEYDRQVKELTGAQQYRISDIALSNEADAKIALARLKKGERFELVAREMSVDGSKDKGGDLGWLLPDQIVPLISNVVVNLPKGTTAAAPIQTSTGWHLIRLDDKRIFSVPRYEESKESIRQGLLQQKRQRFINQLQSQAKITG
jgi:peptidyl-prolyl cis-trans isomerase C